MLYETQGRCPEKIFRKCGIILWNLSAYVVYSGFSPWDFKIGMQYMALLDVWNILNLKNHRIKNRLFLENWSLVLGGNLISLKMLLGTYY